MKPRRVIVGVPRSGKTSEAKAHGGDAVHSDDFYRDGLTKSQQSAAAANALRDKPELAEGVMMLYGLRRALNEDKRFKPADVVTFLGTPKVPLSPGQEKMAGEIRRAWPDIKAELVKRGVTVEEK